MTLNVQIEDGRRLVARLERYTYTRLSDIPPAERMAASEVSGWFSAARSLIAEAFGDQSKQLGRWDELQSEITSDEIARRALWKSASSGDISPDSARYIARIHRSMGLLTEFQHYLNAHPANRALAAKIIRNNPWVSGSFYLFAFLSILIVFRVVFGQLSPWLIPPTVFGSLITVTVIGAFQLRNDDRLKEKKFIELMSLSFRSMPLIGRLMPHNDSTK